MTSHNHSTSSQEQEAIGAQQNNQCLDCGVQQPQSQPRQPQALTAFQREVSIVRMSEGINSVIRVMNRKRNRLQLKLLFPLVSVRTGVVIPDFPRTLEELAGLEESKVDAIMRELGVGWFARGRVEAKQMWIRMNWVAA